MARHAIYTFISRTHCIHSLVFLTTYPTQGYGVAGAYPGYHRAMDYKLDKSPVHCRAILLNVTVIKQSLNINISAGLLRKKNPLCALEIRVLVRTTAELLFSDCCMCNMRLCICFAFFSIVACYSTGFFLAVSKKHKCILR